MLRKKKRRSSGKLSVIAIWNKSRSYAGGVFCGIGDLPNKQETSDFAEAEIGQFSPYGGHKALLAGYSGKTIRCVSLKATQYPMYNLI